MTCGLMRSPELCNSPVSSAAHMYSPGRSLRVWFTPVVMWWAPRRAVLDIWRAGGGAGTPWLINAWWSAWLAKSVGVPLYMVIDLQGNPNDPYITTVHVGASILAILVIQQVTTSQAPKTNTPGAGAVLQYRP